LFCLKWGWVELTLVPACYTPYIITITWRSHLSDCSRTGSVRLWTNKRPFLHWRLVPISR
jgi:hypothetical protein